MVREALAHVINKEYDCHNIDNQMITFYDYMLRIGFSWNGYTIVEMLEDKTEIWLDYYPG